MCLFVSVFVCLCMCARARVCMCLCLCVRMRVCVCALVCVCHECVACRCTCMCVWSIVYDVLLYVISAWFLIDTVLIITFFSGYNRKLK